MKTYKIISDTSCLIVLSKIDKLNFLHQIFGTITITQDVAKEYGHPLPKWFEIQSLSQPISQKIISTNLDRGESSSIALALEVQNPILIIDESKGRKLAEKLGITVTGTLGVLHKAKQKGIIRYVKPLIEELKNIEFRISKEVENEILTIAGEN